MDMRLEKRCGEIAGRGELYPILRLLEYYYEEFLAGAGRHYPAELCLPLALRPSGILEAMEWIAGIEKDVNAVDGVVLRSPLSLAVSWCDAAMVGCLIDLGADVHRGPWGRPGEDNAREYYLSLDSACCHMLREDDWEYSDTLREAIKNTALTLARSGQTHSFCGPWLAVNAERGKVILPGPLRWEAWA